VGFERDLSFLALDHLEGDIREKMVHAVFCKSMRFVRHDGPGDAATDQFAQQVVDAGIRTGGGFPVPAVVVLETGKEVFDTIRRAVIVWNGARDQHARPVSDKLAIGAVRVGGQPGLVQDTVGGRRQVVQRVQKRTVQVKKDGVYRHGQGSLDGAPSAGKPARSDLVF